jgi:hypothetical protein
MNEKESAKRSNLLKFEATMLFTQIKNQLETSRWFFFDEARRQNFSLRLSQSISPFRATLYFRLVHCGILYDAYLEREAHIGEVGDDMWMLSFPSIEGKTQAALLRDHLSALRTKGFDIPNGEEYLNRQMNFSLGLFASCLMSVEVRFPLHTPPFAAFCQVMDHLESFDDHRPTNYSSLEAATVRNEEDTPDILFGDWQTWK